MYLYSSQKIDGWEEKDYVEVSNILANINVSEYDYDPKKLDISKLCNKPNLNQLEIIKKGKCVYWFSIFKELGYWRKANHIHQWFVKNIQYGEDDREYYFVSKEKLNELLNISQKILNNFLLSPTLLPTQEGFFFGDTDYDNYYLHNVEKTYEIIKKILEEIDFEKEVIFYSASW